jgi:hypothetical protein
VNKPKIKRSFSHFSNICASVMRFKNAFSQHFPREGCVGSPQGPHSQQVYFPRCAFRSETCKRRKNHCTYSKYLMFFFSAKSYQKFTDKLFIALSVMVRRIFFSSMLAEKHTNYYSFVQLCSLRKLSICNTLVQHSK